MKKTAPILFMLLFAPVLLMADAGILIPRDKMQPDPAILSLEEMEITIRIDNGDARVFVRQIFANHTDTIEEGNYLFALPSQATVSDFAVLGWAHAHPGGGARTQAGRGNLHSAQTTVD
jgi:Ca-activated chloride channel family protein